MPTLISDVWTPAVWLDAIREQMATFPSVFNSRAVVSTPQMGSIASGAGISANIPFWKDITDQADEPQVENTGPSDNVITTGLQVCTILNRVTKNSAGALAAAVSGGDPVQEMSRQIADRRLKQRNTTLINLLNGLFHFAAASGAGTGCIRANRYDAFDESGLDATSPHLIDHEKFIDAKALMGEMSDTLVNGAMFAHTNVIAGLEKQDQTAFKEASMGPYTIRTYRGIPIFVSDALARAGGTNGYVYGTYLIAPGAIAIGEKPQQGDSIDVASLQYDSDKDKNNEMIYDRTRFLLHVLGTKWVGTPSGQSATNAELATNTNWNLVISTANRVPIVLIRTNG